VKERGGVVGWLWLLWLSWLLVGWLWLSGCKGGCGVVVGGEGDGPVVGWWSSGVREHSQGRS
jgi:hypothetical protein